MNPRTILLFWLACVSPGVCATSTNRDLSEFFGGRAGCFVLYDAQADSFLRSNPKSCAERFTPCSTFKIANSLVALHTGVATGPEFSLKWDGKADIARLGWFVGCVTKGERRVFFATRITGERDASGGQARKITEAILKSLRI